MATICMLCDSTSFSTPEPSVNDDMALVRACKRGNVHAFEELVKRHEKKLFRVAQHVTQNREDAQDVVQDAFLRAFRKLDQFQENSQFSTWLVRITINQSLVKVRKPHRNREVAIDQNLQTETGELFYEPADWAPSPEERYQASELRGFLLKALRTLQPTLSLVFVLRDMEGMSIEQTSEVLDISQVAVKSRLMRARLQLRDQLSNYFRKGCAHHGGNFVRHNIIRTPEDKRSHRTVGELHGANDNTSPLRAPVGPPDRTDSEFR